MSNHISKINGRIITASIFMGVVLFTVAMWVVTGNEKWLGLVYGIAFMAMVAIGVVAVIGFILLFIQGPLVVYAIGGDREGIAPWIWLWKKISKRRRR